MKMIREILESLKELILDYIKHRLFPITLIVLVLFSVLVHRLFVLQIIEGKDHLDNFIYKSKKTLTIESVRGNIYDCNGNLLAYNDLSYSLVYSNNANIENIAKEQGISINSLKNTILYKTITILETNGDSLYVDFPIELTSSGTYKYTCGEYTLRSFLQNVYSATSFDNLKDEQKNATANDVMEYLTSNKMFDISEDYSKDFALKIVSCRYKLWLNRYQQYVPVTIAYDISDESNAAITEYGDELLGMNVSVKSLRKYNEAVYFSHIIGYIGAINADEMSSMNAKLPENEKYSGDEMIGKTGIEQYCESYLRGQNGSEVMYVDNLGKVIETIETTPAEAGNDVYLTLDTNLQKYCYNILEKEIASILLSNMTAILDVPPEENALIPISDVYFGFFNNNYLTLEAMSEPDASDLEKNIYNSFVNKKSYTLERLKSILTEDYTPLYNLSSEYQNYMEYICEILGKEGIYSSSKIDKDSEEFLAYTNDETSLADYLKYAISCEAIDISVIETEEELNNTYYDNDETYSLLCDYIIDYLSMDPEFDKLIIKVMIKSAEIPGSSIVHLLYLQGVLNEDGDTEYKQFKNNQYDAYEFMLRKIQKLDITPAMLALAPCSGAVIVTDVNTGDVKALVSYPSYDNNYLTNEVNSAYYNVLLEDKTAPLYNRACQQKTAPGSTYKPLSAIAGLTEGVIDPGTYVCCLGEFDKITPPPKCWAYPNMHGSLNVSGGIQNSCNVFFYQVGYSLAKDEKDKYNDSYGISRLAKYAEMFGLNDLSGVEIPEITPSVSDSDSVRSAIGQGTNAYAPVQISRYITTVANSGTCFNLTLIDKVKDYEGNLVLNNKATVFNQVTEVDQTSWDAVHAGMRGVVTSVGRYELINQLNVNIAGKTGTAQESEIMPDHALFASYAPYEDPEVSVTCVIQNGYSSGNARELASFIYAYMYDPEKLLDAEMHGNTAFTD